MQIVESRLKYSGWTGLVKIINEVIQASWSFALSKVIGETEEAREGSFDSTAVLTEIIASVVNFVESVGKTVAAKVVKIISEGVTIYDSLTRLIAKAIHGFIVVVGDSVGVGEGILKEKARFLSDRITRWRERRARR